MDLSQERIHWTNNISCVSFIHYIVFLHSNNLACNFANLMDVYFFKCGNAYTFTVDFVLFITNQHKNIPNENKVTDPAIELAETNLI